MFDTCLRNLMLIGAMIVFLSLNDLMPLQAQQRLDSIEHIINSEPKTKTLATFRDGLSRPTDLDFHPDPSKKDLWIVNQRNVNSGGTTLTLIDANTPSQTEWLRKDGNAWHFMSLPTGIAFSSDNYNFATSTGVFDANHNGTDFTGPTLWSSDPDIYAQPSGGNGSHLDMLHGSPFCMGIAHEVDNVFWVTDTYWGSLVRYDFADDHGPGNDYHGDGKVWRYEEESVSRLLDVPSHLVIDKEARKLYAVDNGKNRVLVLDLDSGEFDRNLPYKNEFLAQHWRMKNAEFSEILKDRFVQPCGIELVNNYLMVGDYSNGEIAVFDVEQGFEEIGVIQTEEEAGLTGICVGPDGNIYYTNRIRNIVGVISAGASTVSSSDLEKHDVISAYPNPSDGGKVAIKTSEPGILEMFSSGGQLILSRSIYDHEMIRMEDLVPGQYLLRFTSKDVVENISLVRM